MSTSEAMVWLKLVSVTLTSLTVPVMPEIVIGDGYGDATPWVVPAAGTAMAAVFDPVTTSAPAGAGVETQSSPVASPATATGAVSLDHVRRPARRCTRP